MASRARPARAPLTAVVFPLLLVFAGLAFPSHVRAQAPLHPALLRRAVIVDTDASSDDLMAIAFLLSRPDIRIEAITIANGVAHVPAGGRNVLRLLELAGHRDIPVFLGRSTPLSGNNEFPADWRKTADELPGVTLPEAVRAPETRDAVDYLSRRLLDAAHPVQVLTLGPLTNLAEALLRNRRAAHAARQLVIMGGAIRVPGNLASATPAAASNVTAEWNMFIDPEAAGTVFTSGMPIRLVPLDATQRVPIDMALFEQFQSRASTPLAKFVSQILASNRDQIHQGFFFAWDPLAAAILANPAIAAYRPLSVEISNKPEELGRTLEIKNRRAYTLVAIDADPLRFRQTFMTAFGIR